MCILFIAFLFATCVFFDFPCGVVIENLAVSAGDTRDAGSISGLGRPIEQETTIQSSILVWKILWTEEVADYSLQDSIYILIRDQFCFSGKIEKPLTLGPNPTILENVKSFWLSVTGSMIEKKIDFPFLLTFYLFLVKSKEVR